MTPLSAGSVFVFLAPRDKQDKAYRSGVGGKSCSCLFCWDLHHQDLRGDQSNPSPPVRVTLVGRFALLFETVWQVPGCQDRLCCQNSGDRTTETKSVAQWPWSWDYCQDLWVALSLQGRSVPGFE